MLVLILNQNLNPLSFHLSFHLSDINFFSGFAKVGACPLRTDCVHIIT
jgi:hypothetical protein